MPHAARLLILATLLLALPARGLMPPHVTKITPKDGEVLRGDTIRIEGYSLEHAEPNDELRLVPEHSKVPIAFTHTMTCAWEGRCDKDSKPGACQLKCNLEVKIMEPPVGKKLVLTYLDTRATFRVEKPK